MKDFVITEEEYFEYYQNSRDPTFECYPFPEKDEDRVKYLNEEMDGSMDSGDLKFFDLNDTDDDVFS